MGLSRTGDNSAHVRYCAQKAHDPRTRLHAEGSVIPRRRLPNMVGSLPTRRPGIDVGASRLNQLSSDMNPQRDHVEGSVEAMDMTTSRGVGQKDHDLVVRIPLSRLKRRPVAAGNRNCGTIRLTVASKPGNKQLGHVHSREPANDIRMLKAQPNNTDLRQQMLSDADQRMRFESTILASDWFITKAKHLKHAGDKERITRELVLKYLESALFYILGGDRVEATPNRINHSRKLQNMYVDAQGLVQYAVDRISKTPSVDRGSSEKRLIVLSLRIKAILAYRTFVVMSWDEDLRQDSTSALHEFQPQNFPIVTSKYEDSDLSNGIETPSLSSPHSDAASVDSLGSEHQGNEQVYKVPAKLVENMHRTLKWLDHLERAHDLWYLSDQYMVETNNKGFFDAVTTATSRAHSVDIFTPVCEFVKFARETICRIKVLAN